VYDKRFFVRIDIDIHSDEGLGTTGRLKSQPKNNYVDDHLLSTYEKFRFGSVSAFACTRLILCLPLSLQQICLGCRTMAGKLVRIRSGRITDTLMFSSELRK
jgi:hypothetical protein